MLPAEPEKEVLFQPFPKQEEFIEAAFSGDYSFILFGGAIRGGKTFALLAVFIVLSRIFPGSRWAIVRKDLPTIKRNLYPSWEKIKPSRFIKSFPQNTHTVTFKNGSQIIFFPENDSTDKDKNRWKGLEVNGIGFEELNECQRTSLFKAFERAGSYIIKGAEHQPKPLVLGTCNPTQGWVKDLIYTPWKEGKLKAGWHYIQSRIYDNLPLLEAQPDYLPSLKDNLDIYEYMVFVDGDWDVTLKTGGEFLRKFELKLHVKPVAYDLEQLIFMSIDSNVYPHIAVTLWQIIRENEGFVIRQIEELPAEDPENTASQAALKIVRYLNEIGYGLRVILHGDKSTKNRNNIDDQKRTFFQIINETLQNNGFRTEDRLPSSMPAVAGVADFVNAIFESKISGLRIEIGEHCKASINDYIKTKTAPDGSMLKKRIPHPTIQGVTYEPHGHLCFVGKTLIYTDQGQKPISDIKPGDLVLTRKGFKKVLNKWNNGIQEVETFRIGSSEITCTPDHKFWTKEFGFAPINSLIGLKTFCILHTWKPTLSNIGELLLSDTLKAKEGVNEHISAVGSILMGSKRKSGITSINIYAKLVKYLRDMLCTTLMKIHSIMMFQIMSVFLNGIMQNIIWMIRQGSLCQKSILKLQGLPLSNGINQMPQQNGTNNMSINHYFPRQLMQNALNAELSFKPMSKELVKTISIQRNTNGDSRPGNSVKQEIIRQDQYALFAEKKLQVNCIAQKHVIMREVFDLEVEDEHEYFANGILVHNCDTLKDFIVQAFHAEYLAYIHRHAALVPGGVSQVPRASVRKNIG